MGGLALAGKIHAIIRGRWKDSTGMTKPAIKGKVGSDYRCGECWPGNHLSLTRTPTSWVIPSPTIYSKADQDAWPEIYPLCRFASVLRIVSRTWSRFVPTSPFRTRLWRRATSSTPVGFF